MNENIKRAKFWSRTPGGSLTLVEGEIVETAANTCGVRYVLKDFSK